ncbi:hypothetical protein Tco_0539688 [Tanacetum coccineum]
MSFSKRAKNAPICYTKPLDSLKNWNDPFFWVDASVSPLAVPWHDDKTLRKDPHPTAAEFNVDMCNYLADNPALFRKFPESFLCFVGISREREVAEGEVPLLQLTIGRVVPLAGANDQEDVNVQGVGDDDVNEGDGDAAKANHTKQAIIADKPKRIRKKRKATDGAGGSGLPPKELREYHGISGIGASTNGKSVAALQSLLEGSTLPVEVGVAAATTVPFVTSSVTPDSISGTRLRTRHPAERFAISSDSSHDLTANATDDEVTSVIKSFLPPPPVLIAAIATTITACVTSALVHGSDAEEVQPSIFRDSASPSVAEADITGLSQPVGTELSAGSFYVSQDMDLETLRQVYIPKWNVTLPNGA